MVIVEKSTIQVEVYTDQESPQIDVSGDENMIETNDIDDVPQIEVGDDEPDSDVIA